MFNIKALAPHIWVEVKGKGRVWVDQIDYKGTQQGNKYKTIAIFIKKNPSDRNGRWVPIEKIKFSYSDVTKDYATMKETKMKLTKILREAKSENIKSLKDFDKFVKDEAKKCIRIRNGMT